MDLNRLHNLVFWTFLVLFLATSASVLFFTFGYRFSFERGIFIYTGSITVKANPRSVRLSVDGAPVPEGMIHNINQSYHVTGLNPGEHRLQVDADGFRPWEKEVLVQSGVSTEFWNVLLLRDPYDRTTISTGAFLKAFPSSTGKYFALVTEQDGETAVIVLERKTGVETRVFSSRSFRFVPDDRRNIEWSKDEDSLLIPLRSRDTDGRTAFLVDLVSGKTSDIRDLAPVNDPDNPRWHPDNDGSFFALSEGRLIRVRPDVREDSARTTVVASDVAAYDLSSRSVTILRRDDGSVTRFPVDAGSDIDQEPVTGPIPDGIAFKRPFITVYDEKRIAVYDDGGAGFLWNDDGRVEPTLLPLSSSDMRGVQFSDDGKKLLFHTTTEISVAFTRDWDVQPARASGDVIQIARFSTPISEIQWARDYEHVIFTRGESVEIAELDNRDRRDIGTIVSGTGDSIRQLIPLSADNELHILAVQANSDDATLSFIRFPEPIGIFGQ